MFTRVVIGVFLLAASATAQPVQTTMCDVTRSPSLFDGRMVRLRATVVSGFEAFGVRDPSDEKCGVIWLTYPGGGPVASTSFGPATPNLQRSPVKLKNNQQLKRFQKLLDAEMYPRRRGIGCIACTRYQVTATFTGRLDYAGKGRGFGHMNAYETQLVLESVADVSATDQASHYDLKEFSPTPVHLPTGYLKGRVVAPDGRPVAKAEVNVTSTEDVPRYMHDFTEWADEKGRFKVAVPPGTYLLGINLETPPSPAVPFAATYYPGTADLKTAKKLVVTDRQNLSGLAIRIPERLRERKVPVKVTWPDGKPVDDANVWLAEIRNPTAVVGGAVSHTVADGMFDLIGFDGINYFVHADVYVKPLYKPYCAEPKTLKAEEDVPDRLVMTLTRTGDVCRGEWNDSGFEYQDDPQGWNGYVYTRNNPLLYTDPSGETYEICTIDDHGARVCTKVSDSQFDQAQQTNGQNGLYLKNGGVYYTDQNGKQIQAGTYVQTSVDLNSFAQQALPLAGRWADAGVKAAMVATAPEYLAAGGAIGAVELAGGAASALGGESGLDLVQGSQRLNQMISSGQRQLLRDFFQSGKLPEGLTERSLQVYKEIAQRAIAAGKDELGRQAQRLEMISNALK